MRNWVKWDCIYPNPLEISRNKYYKYKIDGDIVYIYGDGMELEYTVDQLKEFFCLEVGNWDDLLKEDIKFVEQEIKITKK